MMKRTSTAWIGHDNYGGQTYDDTSFDACMDGWRLHLG